MIKVKNLRFRYDKKNTIFENDIINDVSFEIENGEFVAFIGPSGSGKTTLLNLVSGIISPDAGDIYYDNVNICNLTDLEHSKHLNQTIGFIFQQFCLEPNFTVYENVIIPYIINQKITKSDKEKIRNRVLELLDIVGIKDKIDRKASDLSGGEMQRVSIARALMNRPKYIFADEPTGSLDSKNNDMIMELLVKLQEMGHTIIMVTHNLDNLKYCTRVIKIKDGSIVYE